MANDLSTPLTGRKQRGKRGSGHTHLPIARILFALIAVIAIGVVLRVLLVDEPNGGLPSVQANITNVTPSNSVADSASSGPATITADPVQYPAGTPVPDALADTPEAAISNTATLLANLTEETSHGAIPRIANTGETPFAAYRYPFDLASAPGPKIAVIVTGLGINEQGSLDAIAQLPDLVTLAFAPYGKAIENTVSAARGGGHEIMLEVPLEPFDYPQNDPGPHTLLTGDPPRQNLDKLFWLMARFGAYTGVINNMGARFTASAVDFAPIMEELGSRGLGYIDDGSSNRSVAEQLASANKVPFARAGMVIDANPARTSILSALDSLEAQALDQGSAIGIVSALPISVQAIAEWAAELDSKGIALVPASALMK